MSLSFRNFDAGVDVHQSFFEPVPVSPYHRISGIHPSIGFAPSYSDIDFRAGKSDDELRLFQSDQIGEQPAGDIDRMPDGLRADADIGRRAKFIQIGQTGISMGDEQI